MKTRIKELRKQHGWTQDQLGDVIGASKAHVSEMESGKKNPSGPLLERIAQAFGVSISDLLLDAEDDAASLIRDYALLSPADQATIRDLARRLAAEGR